MVREGVRLVVAVVVLLLWPCEWAEEEENMMMMMMNKRDCSCKASLSHVGEKGEEMKES